MRALLVLGLVGCYDPHPSPGAPCSDTEPCPSEQSCIAGTCRLGGGVGSDGGIDAPINDMDRDGIADEVDNCPNVVNTDQSDEDGDGKGDLCDLCPIVPNEAATDTDGDGVPDACDPHPAVIGDKLIAFDGFKDGVVPATWMKLGTVMPVNGDPQLQSDLGNHAAVLAPDAGFGNGTITAIVTIDTLSPSADSGALVSILNPTTGDSIQCGLYVDDVTKPGDKVLDLYSTLINNGMGGDLKTNGFAWATATAYKIVLTRQGNNYTCSETPMGGATMTITGSSGSAPGGAFPSVYNFNGNSHIGYIQVITSP